jgi:hypothetical protein
VSRGFSKPVTISRRLVAPLNWPYSKVIKCRFVVVAAHHRVACADTASHFPFCFAQESV